MSKPDQDNGVAVPKGRLNRLARLGSVATDVGLNVLSGSISALASGDRPDLRAIALSPRNAHKLAGELARMRGAAMKVGQLISMDAGDLLPPEFAEVLARLRADARPMPPKQLKQVLNAAWGERWLSRFKRFDPRPLAAASIGQVHRAVTRDGRDLAIKVQFPGVAESIDSDVDNLGALTAASGLLPRQVDIKPLLAEAKLQLHEEADYLAEAGHLARFHDWLEADERYRLPRPDAELSGRTILAMDYIDSVPLEALEAERQGVRDRIVGDLFALLFRELFELGAIQSDPNLANYRYDPERACLVLLDFGAVRSLPEGLVAGYRALLRAGAEADAGALRAAASQIGYFDAETPSDQLELLLKIMMAAAAPLRAEGGFDFAASDLAGELRDDGMRLGLELGYRHLPPIDALYLHRKFGGLYLLARRLRARVDIAALARPYL
ncbi:AarF/ABC1/UbiB kinase family protein [Maricaulis sp.]|uniref:ABC1 kinase family protein n=1 Tax=Maricaulis sp. TaxID=1486257 RepID=UPI0026026C6B|nr:AarF/ABC1/UbiB kinase family protein [Maricaulis sp.]